LTRAQDRVAAQVLSDMAAPHPMHRLVQGDVGSGKTVIAALVALDAGYQAVVMTPTEVLAEQHAETFRRLLTPLSVEPMLLTGAVSGRTRAATLAAIRAGEPLLVVGTHALIQEHVTFGHLGLAVIDEQHRFGVLQRATLGGEGVGTVSGKRAVPDVLVMTATPIPRTLAMTVYGDLDVSCLDELPPGRQPITTRVVAQHGRNRVYGFVAGELARGSQAFVVFPVVEESDATPFRAATTMAVELQATAFARFRVGLLHGRMRSDEKEETMRGFKAGRYDVLVCTTVIEVGIDVPNATVMVVEHADRFGLAQLHQLRGRVGRGEAPATCFLIASLTCPGDGYERLRVMEETHDGFCIAEADLRIRGPGEFLGTRQAGLPEFRVASLLRDTALLEAARDEANRYLRAAQSSGGSAPTPVDAVLRHRWAERFGL
jgi:ATP-dependent DNA helicase RecG